MEFQLRLMILRLTMEVKHEYALETTTALQSTMM
jgi:hypothetical protein